MNEKYPGTAGTYSHLVPEDATLSVSLPSLNQTIGESSQIPHSPVTRKASSLLESVDNQDMRKRAEELLSAIEQSVRSFIAGGGDIHLLAPVRASLPEDGSVAIEWTNADFRLGVYIEPNPEESGWYLVTSERLGEIGVSGLLSAVQPSGLADMALKFVRINS